MSETDGQNTILTSITGLKTAPLETLVDQNQTFLGTYPIDVLLKFQGPYMPNYPEGLGTCNDTLDNDGDTLIDASDPDCHKDRIRYNNAYDCTTAKVPFTFVSRNH